MVLKKILYFLPEKLKKKIKLQKVDKETDTLNKGKSKCSHSLSLYE